MAGGMFVYSAVCVWNCKPAVFYPQETCEVISIMEEGTRLHIWNNNTNADAVFVNVEEFILFIKRKAILIILLEKQ
jgi:hypothetical protein